MNILLLLITMLLNPDFEDGMRLAATAYAAGDYRGAAEQYETLLASGYEHPALYFNLGNAYYHQDRPGMALVNYLRASEFSPRDRTLAEQITRVRQERLNFQGAYTDFLIRLGTLTNDVLTRYELGWLVGAVWSVWFGLLTVAWLRPDWRRRLGTGLIVLGIGVIIGVVLLGTRWYVAEERSLVVITVGSVPVMSGPGEEYLELFSLNTASEMRILEQGDGWTRVLLPDGRQGWLQQFVYTRV